MKNENNRYGHPGMMRASSPNPIPLNASSVRAPSPGPYFANHRAPSPSNQSRLSFGGSVASNGPRLIMGAGNGPAYY